MSKAEEAAEKYFNSSYIYVPDYSKKDDEK